MKMNKENKVESDVICRKCGIQLSAPYDELTIIDGYCVKCYNQDAGEYLKAIGR